MLEYVLICLQIEHFPTHLPFHYIVAYADYIVKLKCSLLACCNETLIFPQSISMDSERDGKLKYLNEWSTRNNSHNWSEKIVCQNRQNSKWINLAICISPSAVLFCISLKSLFCCCYFHSILSGGGGCTIAWCSKSMSENESKNPISTGRHLKSLYLCGDIRLRTFQCEWGWLKYS